MDIGFLDSSLFQWVILPLLIFSARVMDVSMCTVRIILLSKNRRWLVSMIAFVESFIWLLAIRQVFLNLTNVFCYFAFAGGFATGNYVGMMIEEKLAIGNAVLQVITRKEATRLIHHLKNKGFGVTWMDAEGATGRVNILFSVASRSEITEILKAVKQFNPKAFYTVSDIKTIGEGVFPRQSRLRTVR